MAGIGFELRKLLKRNSLLGMMQAYAYAGIISSGPWVLSILGILVIGVMSASIVAPSFLITQFQVSVTYIIAISLVLTGLTQLTFTRFTADRLFEKQEEMILPNFNGLLLCVTVVSGLLGMLAITLLFPNESLLYRLLMLAGFVTVSNIWMATIFLSGMKQYKAILLLFAVGYTTTVLLALLMRSLMLEGLLGGFVLGQFVLLIGMITLILRNYTSSHFISFDFLRRGYLYPSLIAVGFFYNLGIWLDKFMFWFYPATSQAVIGPLRASAIYDIPVFLAYLSIIPGMAVFLLKMETEFVEYYNRLYDAIRSGGSLEYIERMRNEMVYSVREGIWEIVKIQTITVLVFLVTSDALLGVLKISELYLPLLFVNLVSAALQVIFLGLLNVFFYLDKRRDVLLLTGGFVFLNGIFTTITLLLGPKFYGYGFALALLVCVMAAMHVLDRKLEHLEYETFMLQ
ncbi:MAG: exopolysaccharide Pel transporter PelG [Nitrococcus sp.]|nr:exopolysaccharide Pel transporter PelG [Nitrococcus sp.]